VTSEPEDVQAVTRTWSLRVRLAADGTSARHLRLAADGTSAGHRQNRPVDPNVKKRSISLVGGILLGTSALFVFFSSGCRKVEPEAKNGLPRVEQTAGGPEMVLIPGGSFAMGSAESQEIDEPLHQVYVSSFYVDQHEVTQEEYERVMGKNPSRWKAEKNPVEQIRWTNAAEYCNARSRLEGLEPAYDPKTWACDFAAPGYRLPTEAEWEYAARAGTRTEYCFGDNASKLKDYAWFKENCTRRPQPVGSKEPNPWGLYDMYGNVWEWCNDFYQEDYYPRSPQTDPGGPEAGEDRVVRGGCWNSRPDECRSAYRNYEDPGYTDTCFGKDIHGFVGFRCVKRAESGPVRIEERND